MRISQENMYLWDEAAKEVPISDLLPARDYAGLNGQSEQLRVWLPEAASIGLVAAAKRAKITLTAYLNEYFVTYLYGYYELLRMRDLRAGLQGYRIRKRRKPKQKVVYVQWVMTGPCEPC